MMLPSILSPLQKVSMHIVYHIYSLSLILQKGQYQNLNNMVLKVAMAVLGRDAHVHGRATKYCRLPSQPSPDHPNTDEDLPLSGNYAILAALVQCSAQNLQDDVSQ